MPQSRMSSVRLLFAMVLLLCGVLPTLASAQSAPSTPEATPEPARGVAFVLRPAEGPDGAYFTVEAEPGSTHTLTAVLGNVDDEPLSLRTYASDAFTLVNGGFGIREEDEPREGVSTWIDYEPETFDFAPGEGVERTFTVTVPEDASPGEYIAGIALQTAEPLEIEGSSMFNQIVRKSVAVFILVPGETTPAIELGEPEVASGVVGNRVVVPVSNTGNVLVRPDGDIVLTGADGNEAFRQQLAMGAIYAGTETTLEVPLPAALPEGEYEVSVQLADEATGAQASVEPTTLALSRDTAEAPLEVTSATVTPMPSTDDVQFASVAITVENRELPVEGVRVVLNVQRDGQPVEDFVLSSSVTLQQGETVIEQRYIPLEGWSAGEWTFGVTLASTDPQSGAEAVLLEVPVDGTITVEE